MKRHAVKLVNPVNNEVWFCNDYHNVTIVEGVEFVRVFKEEYPQRVHLIRKDALRKIIKA
jgi:hypothetical protein